MSGAAVRESIMRCLEFLLEKYPQQRFGQLVSNAVATQSSKMDVFYAPDVMLLIGLRQMVSESRAELGK